MNITKLLEKGLFFTQHAREKILEENIKANEIEETLTRGTAKIDSSSTNNRDRAWNHKLHYAVTYNNLTIVCCESLEKGCLVVSAYHGVPHDLSTNPYKRGY